MQAADLSTSTAILNAAAALLASQVTQVPIVLPPQTGAPPAPGSAAPQRKRGRPPKNRQSLPPDSSMDYSTTPLHLNSLGVMASPQCNNQLYASPAVAAEASPAQIDFNPQVAQNTAEKSKRSRKVDDQQLVIPFEFGWSRIVKFRWQAPGPQILAEVTYKSPSGRIFRSYAKLNEYLSDNLQVNADASTSLLTPEMFTFSSRARVAGTTYQKTTLSSQGYKEYREMTPDETDLLFQTMNDSARNKNVNPTPIYEQIFGAYQPTVMNEADITDAAVNLSAPQMRYPNAPTDLSAGVNRTNSFDQCTKLFSPSPLTNTTSQAPLSVAGSADEQQAMLMFMAAMFMQQQQQPQATLAPHSNFAEEQVISSPSTRDRKQSNNENIGTTSSVGKNKILQEQIIANVLSSLDSPSVQQQSTEILDLHQPETLPQLCALTEDKVSEAQPEKPAETLQKLVTPVTNEIQKVAPKPNINRELARVQKARVRQQERKAKLAELKQELNRQPAEDMALIQRRSLPELPRFAEFSLLAKDHQAIADCLHVFEFVQTFANVLGLDINGLPSLACLERGIAAADRQSLLEVTDLLCRLVAIGLQDSSAWVEGAVEDLTALLHSGNERGHHHKVPQYLDGFVDDSDLWQLLPKLPIDRTTVSEVTRHFLAVRNLGRQSEETKLLAHTYFQVMSPRHRARVLAAICDELLVYSAVLSEIERNLLKSVETKRDLQAIQNQLKSLQTPISVLPKKATENGENEADEEDEGGVDLGGVSSSSPTGDDEADQSVTGVEEETVEANKKIIATEVKKLTRQEKNCRIKLIDATNRIRALNLGLDRFGRSYWRLPHVGALLVHGHDFTEIVSPTSNVKAEEECVTEPEATEAAMKMDVEIPANNIDELSSSESNEDEIEQGRWSPPTNLALNEERSLKTMDSVSQAANSPNVPRSRKSIPKLRKLVSSDNNTASSAVDLSQTNPIKPTSTTIADGEPNIVTVDPAALLHSFLMMAKSLGFGSSVASTQDVIGHTNPNESLAFNPVLTKSPQSAMKNQNHSHQHLKVHFEDECMGPPTEPEREELHKEVPFSEATTTSPPRMVDDAEAEPSSPHSEIESDPSTLAYREIFHDKIEQIPVEMAQGWWRIDNIEQVSALISSLNPQGVRERNLLRNLQRNLTGLTSLLNDTNSINVLTHGDFFKTSKDGENHTLACDLTALKVEMETEAYVELKAVADAVFSVGSAVAVSQGNRGRQRKSHPNIHVTSLNITDLPTSMPLSSIEDTENEGEEVRLERSKAILANIAFALASKNMLSPPFSAVAVKESAEKETEIAEGDSIYQLSDPFKRLISGIQSAQSWSALKLRLAQLEYVSTMHFPKDINQALSPKKQHPCTKDVANFDVGTLCRQLLDSLRDHIDALPFLYPVSRAEYPSYFKIIETPMDLQTIDNKIHQNCYRSIGDFADDVRLIFANCHEFNAEGSEIYEQATRLKRFFERKVKQICGST